MTEALPPLLAPDHLERILGAPGLVVLDIRPPQDFAAGHVPGAVASDYAADGWRVARDGAGGALPEERELAALLGRLGIAPDSRVVVVSAGAAPNDFSAAARVYWTFRVAGHRGVSLLDGGFAGWKGPVEAGAARLPAAVAAAYPVRIDTALRATTGDVERDLGGPTLLLDGRSEAQFRGLDKSPLAARPGRLPGAAHLDHTLAFVPGTGRLRPREELGSLFAPVAGEGAVVSYCNTGHLASANWFILSEVLGRPRVALYDGSMSEWTAGEGRPVEVG